MSLYIILKELEATGRQVVNIVESDKVDAILEQDRIAGNYGIGVFNPRSAKSMISFGSKATKENIIVVMSHPTLF